MEKKTKKSQTGTTTVSLDVESLLMPLALIISTIIFSISFVIGMGRVDIGTVSTKGTTVAGADDSAGAADAGAGTGTVTAGVTSIDDDPIKGDRDAKVFIVEFSDYECPYCAAFYNETEGQIIENYVNSGDVAFVYRDLPLSFHPYAQPQAEAAECIRAQSNDETYWEAHDAIFDRGGQLENDELVALGGELGVDEGELSDCIENGDMTEEVNADASDASAAGVSGTPGFIVGTIDDDGVVTGEVISGAQPYSVFETAIEKYL